MTLKEKLLKLGRMDFLYWLALAFLVFMLLDTMLQVIVAIAMYVAGLYRGQRLEREKNGNGSN